MLARMMKKIAQLRKQAKLPAKRRKPVSGATRVRGGKPKKSLKLPTGWVKPVLLALPVLLLGGVVVNTSQNMAALPVGEIIVTGHSQNIEQREILQRIDSVLEQGFWSLDLQAVKTSVEQHPWVRQAFIQRQWPDQLLIGVDEHVPVARWGSDSLLSATGKIFTVDNQAAFVHLPVFIASDSEVYRVVEVFNYAQSVLAGYELSVVGLEGASSKRWALVLDNGMRIELGYWEDRDKLRRVNQLFDGFGPGDIDRISSIDLRYPNGLAVAWKNRRQQLGSSTAVQQGGATENTMRLLQTS